VITVFVKIRAKPGCEEELQAGVRTLVAATQQEPGAVSYHAFVSQQDPAVIRFHEVWKDAAARDFHREAPHLKSFYELAARTLAQRAEIEDVIPLDAV